MTIGATQSRLGHVLQVVHGVTGQPVDGANMELVGDAWKGWRVEQRNGHILLVRRDGFSNPPAETAVRITLERAEDRRWYDESDLETVHTLSTAPRPTGFGQSKVSLAPAPSRLHVQLSDELGAPIPGAEVQAQGSSGSPARDLTESSHDPGSYFSDAVLWDERYFPFAIVVEGTIAGMRRINYFQPVTRFRLVTSIPNENQGVTDANL